MNPDFLKNKKLDDITFNVVDVETTGMSPEFNRIIEIGIVKVKGFKVEATYEALLNPCQEIDPWITYYTNIRNDDLKGRPVFSEIAGEIEKMLKNTIFVAHNAGFDRAFLSKEMNLSKKDFNCPVLCTVRLSRKFLPGLDFYHLDAVSQHYDIIIKQRHRALPDAYATALVLIEYLKTAKSKYRSRNFFDFEKLQWGPAGKDKYDTEFDKLPF